MTLMCRGKVLNILEHFNDDASSIPRRELSQLLYGHGSVYSRRPTPKQIQSFKMQDLTDFLARWERPDNTIFGISGGTHHSARYTWLWLSTQTPD